MDVRSQISMVFHLDKCIGCHTCSIACKNVWTDRKGTEYMWWNNVETKPGTGYPTKWEDQEEYPGRLGAAGRQAAPEVHRQGPHHSQHLPQPVHAEHGRLLRALDLQVRGPVQRAPRATTSRPARPISKITGNPMNIEAGPNWDDDLGGSPVYAANDPNLDGLSEEHKAQLMAIERLVFFYLPRICNHCLNPSCVASCPSGAFVQARRGRHRLDRPERVPRVALLRLGVPVQEDLLQLADRQVGEVHPVFPRASRRGRRRLASTPASAASRYLGVLLYDADRIEEVATLPNEELIEGQRSMILDPHDPAVNPGGARQRHPRIRDRVGAEVAGPTSSSRSGRSRCRRTWSGARCPCCSTCRRCCRSCRSARARTVRLSRRSPVKLFHEFEQARVPLEFLGNLLGAGHTGKVSYALQQADGRPRLPPAR